MNSQQKCEKHSKEYSKICLAEDCQLNFLICDDCDLNVHKHSKTQISLIKDIRQKLKDAWEPKESIMDGYIKKSRLFYENLKKQMNKLIDDDQRIVENILGRVKYHHLPVEANSAAYIDLMKSQYDHLDKNSIVTLLNEAQNGQENKDLQKQKQISSFLDLELKKINDKVLTLKYILLSKKLETQMLIPKLSQPSKVADNDQFTRVYSLFNSRKMLIRSAKLIYSAKDNDFSSDSFYNNCIGVHNCLVIAKTKNNKIIGGFCPNPLVYHDRDEMTQESIYQSDDTKRSFIFSITNLKSFSLKDSHKALIYKKDAEGPSFGVDLFIGKEITSSIGNSYESPEGVQVDSLESKVYLLEGEKVQADNFEVWQMSF